jgi:hypothetical protein
MGEPDKIALRAALEVSGWSVERVDRYEWWIHEAWLLRSTWRPQDALAYITFVTRPDYETGRASLIADVWEIAVTLEPPRERLEHGRTNVSVQPQWPERLREVVDAAAALRPVG